MNSNKLVINLTENEEVKEYLATKDPGEECSFEVVASLDETAPDHAVMSVKEITVLREPEDIPEVGEEGGAEGKGEPPAAVMVALGVGKKRKTAGEEY